MILYHGSHLVVKQPNVKYSRKNNDYGLGFYCTEHLELAREWVCGGVVTRGRHKAINNKYEIDLKGLNILDLSSGYSILNWLAILIQNRTFDLVSDTMQVSFNWLKSNYNVDISEVDIVMGYRADDSYFTFAKDFLSNTISLEKLKRALYIGNLGNQVVIKSDRAYKGLKFKGYEVVDFNTYSKLYIERDRVARDEYRTARGELSLGETYIIDLMRLHSNGRN